MSWLYLLWLIVAVFTLRVGYVESFNPWKAYRERREFCAWALVFLALAGVILAAAPFIEFSVRGQP